MEAQITSYDGFASSSRQPTPRKLTLSVYSFKSTVEWAQLSEFLCMSYLAILNLRTVLRLVLILAWRAYGSISIVCGGGGISLWLSACANDWNQALSPPLRAWERGYLCTHSCPEWVSTFYLETICWSLSCVDSLLHLQFQSIKPV